jgi:hypothetical protein
MSDHLTRKEGNERYSPANFLHARLRNVIASTK